MTRGGRETPCRTCPKPLLDYRNEWVWEVFHSLASQSRVAGMGGFIGFDYTALPFILEAKGVPESLWGYALEKIELLTPIASGFWNKKEDK